MARIWMVHAYGFMGTKLMEFEDDDLVFVEPTFASIAESWKIDSPERMLKLFYGRFFSFFGTDDKKYFKEVMARVNWDEDYGKPVKRGKKCRDGQIKVWKKRRDGVSQRYCVKAKPYEPVPMKMVPRKKIKEGASLHIH